MMGLHTLAGATSQTMAEVEAACSMTAEFATAAQIDNLAHGLSAAGFWLDRVGRTSLTTPSYAISASSSGPAASDPISPLIVDPPSSDNLTSMPGDQPDGTGFSSPGTADAQPEHDLSVIAKADLVTQDTLSRTSDSEAINQRDSATVDQADLPNPHDLSTKKSVRGHTDGDPLTLLTEADSVRSDPIESPPIEKAAKGDSARSV